VSSNYEKEPPRSRKPTNSRQGYHEWNFANGEILAMWLRLIACAVGFGGPLIAGGKGCDQQPP
jgi:hypothetical protein